MATMFSSKSLDSRPLKHTMLALSLLVTLLILLGTTSEANAETGIITIVNSTNATINIATAKYDARTCPHNDDPSQSTVGCVPQAYMLFNGWWPIAPGKSWNFSSENRIYVQSADGSRIFWPNVTEFDGLVRNGYIFNNVSIPFGSPGHPDNAQYQQELTRLVNLSSTYTRVQYQNLGPGTYDTKTATQSTASTQSTTASSFQIVFINKCSGTIETAVRFQGLNDQWTTNGWVELAPGASATVASTKNPLYYYYGRIKDIDYRWSGSDNYYTVAGSAQTYGFKQQIIPSSAFGTWTWGFSCDNYVPASNTNTPPQTSVSQVNVLSAVERIDENSIAELLAASGDYVYWKDSGTKFLIRGQVINGRLTAAQTIDDNSIAELLAASGDYVYWKDSGTKFLIRGQVINGRLTAAQTIDDNSTAELLAASGDYVYWKDSGTKFLIRGQVINGRLTAAQTIDDNSTAELLAASGDYVYWKDSGTTILFRGKVIDGHLSAVEKIDENSVAEALAASGDYVFWKDPGKNILFRGQVIAQTVASYPPPTVAPAAGSNPPSTNGNTPSSTPSTPSSNTNAPSSTPSAPPTNTNAPSSVSNTLPVGAATCPIDLCVTNITVLPNPPKRNQEITFTATFVNNSGGPRNLNWVVLVYDPNKSGLNQGFGESLTYPISVPLGISTSTATYTGVHGGGGCIPLYARAAYYQGDSTKPTISGSDGQPFTVYFDVCP